ncbi:NHLP bacteriocin system secretion protein [Bosea sp. 2KB_26]|uniref:NHLP bacteriocin system secretion protein n=2 Tax=Pseudomonadota TaxID=1224 RepID=UPI000DE28FDD
MTTTSLFRPQAQLAYKHPTQLAAGLRLVSPGYAVGIITAALLVVGAVTAAAIVQVPIHVKGSGVILSSKGVLEIAVSAAHDGRVVDILVDVGDKVTPGQEIARVTQPGLENDRKLAEAERDIAVQDIARIRELQERVTGLTENVRQQQESGAREAIRLLEQRAGLLEPLAEKLEIMRQQGATTIERYLQVRAELAEARERLVSKRSELLALVADRVEKQSQYERELQALEARRAQAQRQIERLEDRLRNETAVRSSQFGIVSELKMMPGDLVRYDTPIISLLPVDESYGRLRPGLARLVAAVLVPAQDGKKVRPGMRVLVDPTSVRRDVFGAIEATVIKVSDVAASPEQLRHMLRNDSLVQKLTAEGPPFLVTVDMNRSALTQTGFAWTTSNGPDTRITSGTLLQAEIETERVSVLQLLLPALKDLLRGPHKANHGA